jgi:uncharacterized protein
MSEPGILRRFARQTARGFIRVYQLTWSSIAGRTCRYLPTCSEYADAAIARYGVWAGGWLALARITRCNPLGSSGFDPIPEHLNQAGRWYFPWRYGVWHGPHDSESNSSQ